MDQAGDRLAQTDVTALGRLCSERRQKILFPIELLQVAFPNGAHALANRASEQFDFEFRLHSVLAHTSN